MSSRSVWEFSPCAASGTLQGRSFFHHLPNMSHGDQTTQIQRRIDSLGAGDASAREALLACAAERLTRLTHKMLKDYRGVHRWEETDDVLQNATLRSIEPWRR